MEELILQIVKYVAGVAIVGLVANSIKMYLNVLENRRSIIELQKDTEELKKQRAADLIEFSSTKALAVSFEQKLDSKIKDVVHEFSEQRHKDTKLFTDALHQIEKTLIKINTTLDLKDNFITTPNDRPNV